MTRFFERLDYLAGIGTESFIAKWLDRIAFGFLLLMALAAPHSIAASQSAWLLGLLATVLRFAVKPRSSYKFTALHLVLVAMFLWAVVSSAFSYEPAISLDKLRGVGLFMVFVFAFFNIRNIRAVKTVVFLLIFSCMFNIVWSLVDRAIGHGIQVFGVAQDGPLGKAGIIDGDALLTGNGQKIRSADQLAELINSTDKVEIRLYRPEEQLDFAVNHSDLMPGDSANEKLGIAAWQIGRNWRAQGFYSHFTTYAETLQLIASLLFGLIVGSLVRRSTEVAEKDNSLLRFLTSTPVMIASLAAILIVLILTVTRASQLAFMVAAFLIIIVSGSRKLLFAAVIIAFPLVLGGMLFLQQTRGIGFVDSQDESTQYRMTMWRDGWRLSHANAHNLVFGLGMDSIKKHWQEWGMFNGGFLPMGHFHSTPMQMLVERGVPGLLIWLAVIFLYGLMLWRAAWQNKKDVSSGRWTFGILLGCLGAVTGFFVSGLVHYNIGDGEVAMIFYLLMAIGVRTSDLVRPEGDHAAAQQLRVKMAA